MKRFFAVLTLATAIHATDGVNQGQDPREFLTIKANFRQNSIDFDLFEPFEQGGFVYVTKDQAKQKCINEFEAINHIISSQSTDFTSMETLIESLNRMINLATTALLAPNEIKGLEEGGFVYVTKEQAKKAIEKDLSSASIVLSLIQH